MNEIRHNNDGGNDYQDHPSDNGKHLGDLFQFFPHDLRNGYAPFLCLSLNALGNRNRDKGN
jgi:hypothetical protein